MDIIRNFEAAATLMSSDTNSQLALMSKRQHIKLSPKYLDSIRTGISCHMTCDLARYSNELDGAPVAFKNVKVVQRMGRIIADQTCIHFDVDADFIVFKPSVGCTLSGKINKVTKEHIGCLVHGCFNAWMPHSCLTQKMALDKLNGSEIEFSVESISTHNVMSVKGKFGKLIPKPGVKPDEPETEVKKTRKKKKNKKGEPDSFSVDTDQGLGDETILAGAGNTPLMGLDSSGLEPVFSSTQVEGGEVARAGKKAKKHKKKNRESYVSVNETASSSGFNSLLDGASTVDSFVKGSESDGHNEEIHNKKKKKHSRSELSFENGLSQDVSDMNDSVFQASYSAKKKKRKRKHIESDANSDRHDVTKTSSLDDSVEMFSPKKKHKKNKKNDPDKDFNSNFSSVNSVESYDDTQELSELEVHSKAKKKHKKHKNVNK